MALDIIQIIISAGLIAAILLQQRGSGLSSAFGGDSGVYYQKRGMEKILFRSSIALGALFLATAFLNLIQ